VTVNQVSFENQIKSNRNQKHSANSAQNTQMWNQRMLCTNVKPSSGCCQSVTLLT